MSWLYMYTYMYTSSIVTVHSTDLIYTTEIVTLLPPVMRQHLERPEVQIAAANFMKSLAAQGLTHSAIDRLASEKLHDFHSCVFLQITRRTWSPRWKGSRTCWRRSGITQITWRCRRHAATHCGACSSTVNGRFRMVLLSSYFKFRTLFTSSSQTTTSES